MITLSENAERMMLFLYILKKGLPKTWRGKTDPASIQVGIFQVISGLSEFDSVAALAELEDAEMVERQL